MGSVRWKGGAHYFGSNFVGRTVSVREDQGDERDGTKVKSFSIQLECTREGGLIVVRARYPLAHNFEVNCDDIDEDTHRECIFIIRRTLDVICT